jgi:hypothetical protein
MPAGVVFSKYSPHIFGPLSIKAETVHNDFWYQQIEDAIKTEDGEDFGDKLFNAQKYNNIIDMDFDCLTRDGLFEDDQLFAIYDKGDVEKLIDRLKKALLDGYRKA